MNKPNLVFVCAAVATGLCGSAYAADLPPRPTYQAQAMVEYMRVGAGAVNTLKENMVRIGANWRFGM
jgi:uncharacterized protein involved in exopolysaccharide biosynthesis